MPTPCWVQGVDRGRTSACFTRKVSHPTPDPRAAESRAMSPRSGGLVFATMVPIWIFTVSSFRPWGQHYYNDVLDATRCS